MSRLLKGFTLAEVLICLAVVGAAAAMTLPGLVKNSQKNILAASVAKSVSLLQTGMANILQEAQLNSDEGTAYSSLSSIQLSDIGLDDGDYLADEDAFYSRTMSFLNTEEADDYTTANISGYDGAAVNNDITSNLHAYRFVKQKPVILFQNTSHNSISTAEDDDIIARVVIDANGSSNPNRFGVDLFLFGLTNNGILIPAGSQKYYDFDNNAPADGCANTPGTGISCAARIMADNWRVNYY